MLISENVRERRILQMAFEQHQIKVIEAFPDRASYLKALQYIPDFVVIEFPQSYTDQINFSKNIFSAISKKKKILMLGYGQEMVAGEERAVKATGIKHYLLRPLKFSLMMKFLEEHLGVFAPEQMVWKHNKKHTDDSNYIETLFNIDILPTVKLELMSERIESLMAFPFTVLRVLQLTEDSRSGATDLAKVINADPVISASILKMANTVFFASRNRRITTIADAIVRIGFTETKHLTMTMSVMNSMSSTTENIGFDRMQFWHHSMAVAVISEKIAKGINGINSSELFLSGLLHSFGIILIDEFFAELFEKLLIRTTDRGYTFTEAERELIIISHMDLTFRLFDSWQIPHEIVDAIRFSEKTEDILIKETKNISKAELTGLILHCADVIAKSLSLGRECDSVVSHLDSTILELLEMKNGVNKNYIESIDREIEIFRKFLKIDDEVTPEKEYVGKEVLLVAPPLPFFVPIEFYLQRLGFTVLRCTENHDISGFDERFSFIVFWYETMSISSQIATFAELRSIDTREPIKMIVFEESVSSNKEGSTHFFENHLDLRFVTATVQEIVNP